MRDWPIDEGVIIETAHVYSGRWIPVEYDDQHGRRILDAEVVENRCQQGIRTDLGWIWTDEEEA